VAGLLVYRLRSSRAQLVEELSERARHDGLTGLLNRGALEERVRLELANARRSGSPLSLIVLDIDQFKVLNDTKGHPAGDEVLRTIAACLRQETRVIDAVARLGGDEFGALLPGAEEEDAVRVAERLVDHTLATGSDGQVTLSVGVAQVGSRQDSFETLWQAADAAMYEAKRGGGGSVRTASQLEPADSRTAEASASSTRL
jgi:diguanylate cyclase (GGDEF)-like protein